MSDQLRRSARSTRQPPRYELDPPVSRQKRKAQDIDPAEQLQFLLQNPKSTLTTMDISDLINFTSWSLLPSESQLALAKLLPPTAFHGFQPSLEPNHPAATNSMTVDQPLCTPSDMLDTSIFTDPHFLAAARTFQDHIYSDWMSDAHREKVNKFQAGIRDGTLAAAWKDDVWNQNDKLSQPSMIENAVSSNNTAEYAGEASEIRLATLTRNNVVRVGDVLAYKRHFPALNTTIEKDVIIQDIHPKTQALTVLVEPGSAKHLPTHLLSPQPLDPSPPTQSMTFTTPSMLETGILDIDGRTERSKRPQKSWKCFTVWRWRGDLTHIVNDGRGGRENHGTLFYLRNTCYHER